MPASNEQNKYSAQSAVYIANGYTADIFVGDVTELAFDVNVTAIDAGCTLNLYVERKGADGNYYPIFTSAAVTAPGLVSQSIGEGLSDNASFGNLVRIRWTVTVSKTAAMEPSLMGKYGAFS